MVRLGFALGLAFLVLGQQSAKAQSAWTSVDQSSLVVGQSVNVTVYIDDGWGEGLFEGWANWHDPSGNSGILWSTFINYYYQTPWYTTGGCTLTSVGTWWFDAWGYTGDSPRSGRVISGGYAATYASPSTPSVNNATVSVLQGQSVSYQISATNSPTSYSASNLPSGLSLNTSSGLISGAIPSNGGTQGSNSTVVSSVSVSNGSGSASGTITWNLTAANIVPAAALSTSSVVNGQSLTLYRDGTCNFGVGWTQGTIWPPTGSPIVLSMQGLGSQSFTPSNGTGTYWWQFRLIDAYFNFQDQWVSFVVTSPSVTAPTSFTVAQNGSDFVVLSWSGASAQMGISHYNVFRNGVFIGTTSTTTATDGGPLNSSTTYVYTVQTVDSQGNISPISGSFSVTTLGDLELFTPLL